MQQAVYGSLFLGSLKTTTAVCSSGNCTWPQFQTLGVCNRCEDVSSLIQKTEIANPEWTSDAGKNIPKREPSWHLPNGLSVALPGAVPYYDPIMDLPAIISSNGNLSLSQLPMINFTIANISILSTTSAYECNVHWCVKEYNSSMSEAVLSEKPLLLDPPTPKFDAYNGTDDWCDWLANDIQYLDLWDYSNVSIPIGTPIYKQDLSLSSDPDHNCIGKL